jgi:hypothetical protein
MYKDITMKYIGSVLFIPALLFTAGCATVLNGNSQTIPVMTTPAGAHVKVVSFRNVTVFEGETPCRITAAKTDLRFAVMTITKEGYAPVRIEMGEAIDPAGFLNCCTGCIPGMAVDLLFNTWKQGGVGGVNYTLAALPTAFIDEMDCRIVKIYSSDGSSAASLAVSMKQEDGVVFIDLCEYPVHPNSSAD